MKRKKAIRRILATAVSLTLTMAGITHIVVAEGGEDARPAGEITAFAPLPEETAYQAVSLGTSFSQLDLPAALEAEVDGAHSNVPVTWASRPGYDGDVADTYTLTATTDGGYALAPGVRPPEILVRVGEPAGVVPMLYTDYQFHDIVSMNRLITDKGMPLSQFTSSGSSPPADWNNVVIWDTAVIPHRIVQLELSGMGMTGQLNIAQGDFAALEVLNCDSNDLTGISVIGNPLRSLNCDDNQIIFILLGGTDNLEELSCNGNQLQTLDLRHIRSLQTLHCDSNPWLTGLDVSGITALRELNCSGNSSMTSLNVQGCTQLESIDCSYSSLASLDVSGLSSLRALYCRDNQLTDLVLGISTTLQMLYCENNRLYRLDMSGLAPITNFESFNYNASGQNPTLVLEGEDAYGFFSTPRLQSPAFGNSHISYSDRVLKSTDKTVTSTPFSVSPYYQFGGGTATATLSGNMSFTYTAPFTPYGVTVTSGGNGTASANAATAVIGTRITLSARPGSGYRFREWTADNTGVVFDDSQNPTAAFVMPIGDVQVTAHFEPVAPTYTVTVNNGSGGGAYPPGATVPITAAAAPDGQRFRKWVVVSGGITLTDAQSASTTFTMPGRAVEVTATYEALPAGHHTITVQSGEGGTAAANVNSATQGTAVTLTATPAAGYRFREWQVVSGGVTLANAQSASATFTMPAQNVVIQAVFEIHSIYTITFNPNGGTVSPATMQTAADGTLASLPTPSRGGYSFNGWYTQASGGTQITTSHVFGGNTTIYAQWSGATTSSKSSSGSSRRGIVTAKTRLPASAFSWDGDRTLTIDHERITALGLLKVEWDGAATTSYSVQQGSVIVRFDRAFIDSQNAGEHTVRVEFLNHTGETTVTIGGAKTDTGTGNSGGDLHNPTTGGDNLHNPQTGDFEPSPWSWLLALVPAAAVTLAMASLLWKRRAVRRG